MGARKDLTEQLVHNISSLQHRLRLKVLETEALSQRCRDLEAERNSLQAAYDLTRACQAAMLSERTEHTACRLNQRGASYYVPTPLQQSRQEPLRQISVGEPSGIEWPRDFSCDLDEGMCDAERECNPPKPCSIQ